MFIYLFMLYIYIYVLCIYIYIHTLTHTSHHLYSSSAQYMPYEIAYRRILGCWNS